MSRYPIAELVDLTAEVQREQDRRRNQPRWESFWIGFLFGIVFMLSVAAFCWLMGGN